MTPTDADLLKAHAAGDRQAFAELYRRHRLQLHRVARRSSRTAEDADDAVQEAMLSAHRSARSFRHDSTVASWLHRIVVNACLDRGRRNGCTTIELDAEVAALPDGFESVDTTLMVRQALMRLPQRQRAAVVAVDMLGYSVGDAARLFAIAEGTVKSRCSRARARLAVILADR